MVKSCLKQKMEFGLLLALPKGVAHVGCTAEIIEVVKRYDDGRMDILAVGRAPFRVTQFLDENPLLEGLVDYLDDRDRPVDPKTRRELTELYEACHTLVFGDYPRTAEERQPGAFSYQVAGKLPIDLLWKQQMLELRTEADRQERLVAYLREWAPHLQKTEELRQRADGNGHGLN